MLVEQSDGTKRQIVRLGGRSDEKIDLNALQQNFEIIQSTLSRTYLSLHKLSTYHPHFFSSKLDHYEPKSPELLEKVALYKDKVSKDLLLPDKAGTPPHTLKFIFHHFEKEPDSEKSVQDLAQDRFSAHIKDLEREHATIASKILPIDKINEQDKRLNKIQAHFRLRAQDLTFEILKYKNAMLKHFITYVQQLNHTTSEQLEIDLAKHYGDLSP